MLEDGVDSPEAAAGDDGGLRGGAGGGVDLRRRNGKCGAAARCGGQEKNRKKTVG
jgi:hypothetical protein